MAVMCDTDLHLVPGRSVGEFQLGDSLWRVLETMRTNKVRYGGTSVRWDREDPTSPVIIDVPPGIHLVFPHQQLLQLIAVRLEDGSSATSYRSSSKDNTTAAATTSTSGRSPYPGALKLMVGDKHLTTINAPPAAARQQQQHQHQPGKEQLTRSKIVQVFGTTFSRRSPGGGGGGGLGSTSAASGERRASPSSASASNRSSPLLTHTRESEIRYPGIVFQLHPAVRGAGGGVGGEAVVGTIVVVPPGREEVVQPARVLEVLDGTVKREQEGGCRWSEVFTGAGAGEEMGGLYGTIALCEIRPQQGILLHINNKHNSNQPNSSSTSTGTTPYEVELGKTTAQDLLCDLGPPGRKYWKDDEDRFVGRYAPLATMGGVEGGSSGRVGETGQRESDGDGRSRGCWWNYFHLGLDFLVEELGEGRVVKIMVHSNLPGTAQFQTHARCPWTIQAQPPPPPPSSTSRASTTDVKCLSLGNTLDEYTAAFGVKSNGETSTDTVKGGRGGGKTMSTVLLDRLDEEFMTGVQDIEPSRLLALDGMVLEEASGVGITSVLLH